MEHPPHPRQEEVMREFDNKFHYKGNGEWRLGKGGSVWYASDKDFKSFLRKHCQPKEK